MADKLAIDKSVQLKCRYRHHGSGIYSPYSTDAPADSATTASVAADDSSVTLQAANTLRRSLLVFNDADKDLYLKYGATATSIDYTVKIPADSYWEMPVPCYTGIVDGIWATGPTGAALVTELT
jgi:hypothetical protein